MNDLTKRNLGMLLGILEASLLGNILIGKRIKRAGYGIVRAGCGFKAVRFFKKI